MQAIQALDGHGPTLTSPSTGISVVYPTRDRPQFIAQSLTALLANTVLPDEIVVVDQSRTDATRQAIAALGSPLIVHVHSTEAGLSRARNTGIRSSRFPIIGFIDDDCIPARNWVASAKSVIERAPGSAVWVGKVFYDGRFITDEVIAGSRETWYSLKGRNDPWRFGPAGGNSFFPRSTFNRVGCFDPLLGQGSEFPSSEDGDMVYRIFKANLEVTYSDRIRSYHLSWRSEDDELRNSYNYGLGFGALMAKHAAQGDYYPATIVFGRHFLPNYFLVPLCFMLARRRKFRHSLKWSQSIVQGFFRWRRLHRSRSENSRRRIPRH
jgi:glycosyltransferase involved in cell wall biosynthesis